MALPENPISGGHRLTNDGVEDRWTCPNCYEDHEGYSLENTTVSCSCGATLRLTIEQQPICVAECVEDDDGTGEITEEEVPY